MSSRGVDKGATVLSYISSLEYRTISFSSSFRKIRFQLFSSLLKTETESIEMEIEQGNRIDLLTSHFPLHFPLFTV